MNKNIENIIRDKIRNSGPINIEDYMNICSYNEDFGYYRRAEPIGIKGDFITAPEVSQMFGELLAIWLLDIWLSLGKIKINIIELGPGNGSLMSDIIRVAKKYPEFLNQISIYLFEVNQNLSSIQSQNIKYPYKNIESIDDLPIGTNFFIANEFFDAIPIRQFINIENNWHERLIGLNDESQLCLLHGNIENKLMGDFVSSDLNNHNLVYEISFQQEELFSKIINKIGNHGGILIFDYAKIIDGFGDTLQAISNHKYVSIFHKPGSTDLTAYVNYKRYIELAKKGQLNHYGPISQREFLLGMGIKERYNALKKNANNIQKDKLFRQLHRLLDNDKMGEIFKTIYFSNNQNTIPLPLKR